MRAVSRSALKGAVFVCAGGSLSFFGQLPQWGGILCQDEKRKRGGGGGGLAKQAWQEGQQLSDDSRASLFINISFMWKEVNSSYRTDNVLPKRSLLFERRCFKGTSFKILIGSRFSFRSY